MSSLPPLDTLYELSDGIDVPLPSELSALYGRFQLPVHHKQPYVMSNFVTTLDGVVSLGVPGHSGGGDISGFSAHDRMVMGLLRALADAVIVGAGTVREDAHHVWTAEHIYPDLARAYQTLRSGLGKTTPPLNVIVTASGHIDLALPVFQSGAVPVLIVTTSAGRERLVEQEPPSWVQVVGEEPGDVLSARAILDSVERTCESEVILVEGGPRLMGDFLAAHCLDEQFLTLAPQVAGRDGAYERPGFVAGRSFAPVDPLWTTLTGVKRAGSHLFLRYAYSPLD